MSLEFHWTHYERYRREGLDSLKRGDKPRARFCLLKSAEHLFSVARSSTGRLQETRSRTAHELLTLARGIPAAGAHAAPRARSVNGTAVNGSAVAERDGTTSQENGDRFLVPERPDVTFASIAGLDDVKEEIRLRIILPYLHPERAERYGVRTGGGILLYGPPGTGKTLLARAVAGEVDCAFFTVRPSEILSKWVGDAEKNVAALFAAAREHPRAVIFIDEVEALAPRRADNSSTVMARLVPQILAELEGFGGRRDGLLFIGATNEPWSLDPAIVRPGRFDEKIYVGLPDHPALVRMLEIQLESRPLGDDVDVERLAELLAGYSGADVRHMCQKAADGAFLRAIESGVEQSIDQVALLDALSGIQPSVNPDELRRHLAYREGTR